MNLNNENLEWEKLKSDFPNYNEKMIALEKEYGISEIKNIVKLINQLDAPENIKELFQIQQKQSKLGGGFYDLIPEPIKNADEIPVPNTPEKFLDLVFYLFNVRKKQNEIIASTGYPVDFSGEKYLPKNILSSKRIRISLDFCAIKEVLNYFSEEKPTFEKAEKIANNEIFSEMVKHRNSLGYVPGPEFTTEYLATFLYLAASKKPVQIIWKWISPWNLFDFADVAFHKEMYEKLINILEKNKEDIESYVSYRIEKYTPKNFTFQERFVFGIEWAIRGWATEKFGGINIEHVKDNYDFLIDTIIHETFHRIQAMLYPGNNSKEFNMLEKPLNDKKLDAFYKVMTYTFLEGTATYVQKGAVSIKDTEIIQQAIEIFNELYQTIFEKEKYNKLNRILNKGLKSNGPFYTLGHYMAYIIDKAYGPQAIAKCLKIGSPEFFGLFLDTEEGKIFPKYIINIIKKVKIPL